MRPGAPPSFLSSPILTIYAHVIIGTVVAIGTLAVISAVL